jgi:LysR family glycine cleavage system transcriptional activator
MSATPSPRRNASIIRSLQYFEAVARHQSVRLAAEELGVSQSAVSHQLRELTKVLGEQLLLRSGRGIAISPTGKKLAEKLAATFSSLEASLADVVGGGRQILRLAVCSSFGPGWLIPRLNSFIEAYSHIDLQLHLYAQDPRLTDQVADAIVTALPVEPGYTTVHLIDETLVAVHAPGRMASKHRLITTDIESGKLGQDWVNYCNHAGLRLDVIRMGAWMQCTHYLLAQEMARAGLGVALVPDFLARRDIENGALAYFDRTRMPSRRVYNLCYKHSRAHEAGIRNLCQWLKGELASGSVIRIAARRPT